MTRLRHLEVPFSMIVENGESLQSNLPPAVTSLTLRSDASFAYRIPFYQFQILESYCSESRLHSTGVNQLEIVSARPCRNTETELAE